MSLFSFLQHMLGGSSDTAAADADPNGPKNLTLSGKAFKAELEAAEKPVLLDVRTAGEVSGGTLPGAKHLDFMSPNFGKGLQQLDKSATYFVLCRSGNRSGQACKIMHRQGFDVRNLSGGIGAFPSR
ncbi:MAG TPA: rhodanese-like domain-containing protein [Saprospiraceae bacterium]|nr:rhodanese-like domain-containing protein [Saprospiraceae bacterium]